MTIPNNINIPINKETNAIEGRVSRPSVAKANANTFALNMIPFLQTLAQENIVSPGAIAETLNKQGVPTARGGKWAVTTVTNLIGRLAVLKATDEVAV